MNTIETPVNPAAFSVNSRMCVCTTAFGALGQHVLEQERLQRVEPLLEHREARDELERDGGERNEAQQRREREAAGRPRQPDLPRPHRDAAHERDETCDGGRAAS